MICCFKLSFQLSTFFQPVTITARSELNWYTNLVAVGNRGKHTLSTKLSNRDSLIENLYQTFRSLCRSSLPFNCCSRWLATIAWRAGLVVAVLILKKASKGTGFSRSTLEKIQMLFRRCCCCSTLSSRREFWLMLSNRTSLSTAGTH